MFIKEKKTFAMTYRDIGLLCPTCYCEQSLGNVTIHATIEVAPNAEESNIRFNQSRILNYPFVGETTFAGQPHSFIYGICPECGCPNMIPVDNDMLPCLQILNRLGAYTKYSCIGHTDGHGEVTDNPYIAFGEKLPSEVINTLMGYGAILNCVPRDFLLSDGIETILGLHGAHIPKETTNTVILSAKPYTYDHNSNSISINVDAADVYAIYKKYPEMFWANLVCFFDQNTAARKWCESNKAKYGNLAGFYNFNFGDDE